MTPFYAFYGDDFTGSTDVLEQLDRLPADFKQRDDFKEVQELVQRAQSLSIQEWQKHL